MEWGEVKCKYDPSCIQNPSLEICMYPCSSIDFWELCGVKTGYISLHVRHFCSQNPDLSPVTDTQLL